MSDTLPITPLEQRQLHVITRRLDQVDPVVDAIHRATAHLPAADRIAVRERLHDLGERSQRGPWDVSQPRAAA